MKKLRWLAGLGALFLFALTLLLLILGSVYQNLFVWLGALIATGIYLASAIIKPSIRIHSARMVILAVIPGALLSSRLWQAAWQSSKAEEVLPAAVWALMYAATPAFLLLVTGKLFRIALWGRSHIAAGQR